MDEELRAEIRQCVREAVFDALDIRAEMLRRDPTRPMPFDIADRLKLAVLRLEETTLQMRSWASGCKYNASDIASILQLATDINSKV